MATPHFRHQLHLHGSQLVAGQVRAWTGCATGGRQRVQKLLLLAGLLVGLGPGMALAQHGGGTLQKNRRGKITGVTVDNLPAYNNRFFRPGFYIAPNFSRFFIEQSSYYIASLPGGVAATSIISPGLGVGFIGDIRLGPPNTPLHLRFAPGVSFLTRQVEFQPRYYRVPDSIKTQEISSTQIEFPFLLKYQSDRRHNTRLYMVGGIKPSVTVGNRRSDPLRNMLRAVDSDLTLEYGVGVDLFYPYFKFAPELRFSYGLNNVLQPRGDFYTRNIQSLRTNTVTLYLNFE